MPIAVSASVMLVFQLVGLRLCNISEQVWNGHQVCSVMTDSAYPALDEGYLPDTETLDMTDMQYMDSHWVNSSTKWSFFEYYRHGTESCYAMIDGDGMSDYPCPEQLN